MLAYIYFTMVRGKKVRCIERIFNRVRKEHPKSNILEFDNDLVKEITKEEKFSNQFDAVKFDSEKKMPEILQKEAK